MIYLFKLCKYLLVSVLPTILIIFILLCFFNIINLNVFSIFFIVLIEFLLFIIISSLIPYIYTYLLKRTLFIENNPDKYKKMLEKIENGIWKKELPLNALSFLINSNAIYLIYKKEFKKANLYLIENNLNFPLETSKYIQNYFEYKTLLCLSIMFLGNIDDFIYSYENLIDEIQFSNEKFKSNTISLNDVFHISLKYCYDILSIDHSDVETYIMDRIIQYKNITQMTILHFINYVICKGNYFTDEYYLKHKKNLF